MRHRLSLIVAFLAIFLAGAAVGQALATCDEEWCAYLPAMRQASAAGPTCEEARPLPLYAGGSFEVWATRYTVDAGESVTVCAHSPLSGTGYRLYAILHSSAGDFETASVPLESSGLKTFAVPPAALVPGELIGVDVVLTNTGNPGDGRVAGQTVFFVRSAP
jgi:hypothetical protein